MAIITVEEPVTITKPITWAECDYCKKRMKPESLIGDDSIFARHFLVPEHWLTLTVHRAAKVNEMPRQLTFCQVDCLIEYVKTLDAYMVRQITGEVKWQEAATP